MIGLVALMLCAGTTMSIADDNIGNINELRSWARGTIPGAESELLYKRDNVYSNQTIEVANNGAMKIRFSDETELFLDGGTQLILDDFVYTTTDNSMVLTFVSGGFRFISGRIAKEKVSINTTVATLGIRGTDFEVQIDNTDTIVVKVFSGRVIIDSFGQPIYISNGCETIRVSIDEEHQITGCSAPSRALSNFGFSRSADLTGGSNGNDGNDKGDREGGGADTASSDDSGSDESGSDDSGSDDSGSDL